MKKVFITSIPLSVLLFAPPSFAQEMVNEEFSETVQETTPEPTPEPTPTYAPGMAPGEHAGWVPVDSNGNVVGGGIVCTPEVCGQTGPGSWIEGAIESGILPPGSTLVLQTTQDPVEASNSPHGVGNVATYPDSQYNFQSGAWTMQQEDGAVYEIPLAYPGVDQGGNTNLPICIENCPPPPCEEDPNYLEREDCIEQTYETNTADASALNVNQDMDDSVAVERSKFFVIENHSKTLNKIKITFHKKQKNINIVAKKWDQDIVHKKVWNIKNKKMKKIYTFTIPDEFVNWKVIVKNKKNIKNIRLL